MADISFLRNEDMEDTDEPMEGADDEENGGDGPTDGRGDEGGGEQLPPMTKLQQHASCNMSYNRQLVGRILVEVFRGAVETGTELNVDEVMQPVLKLVNDTDPVVRLDLVEQLPHVAMICQEAPDRLGDVLPRHLIQIIVRFLHDIDQQVRQSTHAALLALIDRGLLDKDSAEYVVAPTLLRMSQQVERLELFTLAIDMFVAKKKKIDCTSRQSGCDVVTRTHITASFDERYGAIISLRGPGMSKVARILDEATAERLFLNRYLALCKDSNFFIRKLCAIRFGEFSAAMGKDAIYDKLLPMYVTLCNDSVWSVRKSCADVIVSFACCVSLHHRRATLSEILANFLTDDSKWVKVSAFQILGPFISTFAKQFTGFSYNQYGELVLTDQHGTELRYNVLSFAGSAEPPPCKSAMTTSGQIFSKEVLQFYEDDGSGGSKANNVDSMGNTAETNKENVPLNERTKIQWNTSSSLNDDTSDNDATISHDYDQFNPFRYYYIPPELPLDSELVDAAVVESASAIEPREHTQIDLKQTTHPIEPDKTSDDDVWKKNSESENQDKFVNVSKRNSKRHDTKAASNACKDVEEQNPKLDAIIGAIFASSKVSNDESSDPETNESINDSRDDASSVSLRNTSDLLNDTVDIANISVDRSGLGASAITTNQSIEGGQTIVPHVLVNFFVSMADPGLVSIGIEIPRHCAFSFPAVALTLGRENWPLLKEAYAALADAREYRVRRTMASSIHELAMILGEDLAARDLLPIYDGFIKDLDEVRIGALKHLTTFLKVLRPADRRQFLPRLKAFLMMDNEWNWRFREEVASRLLEAIPLFTPADVAEHIAPLSFPLLIDKVAAVRHMALALVTQIISYLSTDEDLVTGLMHELKYMLASKTSKWTCRQTFALLCSSLVSHEAISPERFARNLLPCLLILSSDDVPNVRLAVATALSRHVINLYDSLGDQAESVSQTLIQLRDDPDRDVRIIAGGVAGKYYPQGVEWKVPATDTFW